MFKKWFIRCTAAFVFAVGVLSVTLAYQFTQNDTGVSSPRESALTVEAAAPPRVVDFAELVPVVKIKGQRVAPHDFLADATPSNVVAFFSGEVNTHTPGVHDIILTLDNGSRRAEVMASLYVLDVAAAVTVEAGTKAAPPDALDFIANAGILPPREAVKVKLATEFLAMDSYEAGNYHVALLINGAEVSSTMRVTDTTPPAAAAVGFTVNLGTEVTPREFVGEITDASPVTVTYLDGYAPDVFLSGDHLITVVLEDSFGNKTNLNSMLKVLPNTTPPYFVGLKDMEAFLGDPVMYRMGVTAFDSFGNELEFEVDSETVDISTPGDYLVKYSATDAGGLNTVGEITIKVVNVTEEAIGEMLNAVMESIVTEEMTQLQKARAVFDWISSHIGYVADAPKDSVYEGAYRALRQGNGDCFTFYAIAEVMLTAAGIPNERVTRIEGTPNSHYWNLVNADNAGWYHFDSTRTVVRSIDRFMFTDSEAVSYTEIVRQETGARDYYTYDRTLHPEVVQ